MENWKSIREGFIPKDDYIIDCQINKENTITLLLIGDKNFKITVSKVVGFRVIDESSELQDPYQERGLTGNRPRYWTNYIYEIENAEFGDLLKGVNSRGLKLRHYKVMSMNYLIDIISEQEIVVEKIT